MRTSLLTFLFFIQTLIFVCYTQIPSGYYDKALGKSTAQLKTSLHSVISSGYKDNGYDYLYTIYETSDRRSDGKIWDMYSNCIWTFGQKKCGNYKNVCDCYNREHSIPQSWFNERAPMKSDAFHIYPTDGRVNGQRSNYPFGECSNGTTLSMGKGRLGSSTFSGYSGTVFEPDDEYKGDFARTYFYFATRYEDIMTTIGGESFNGTIYPALSSWSQNLFLKWHRQDPVSQKEIDRNNAIYVHQKNRNPFIDHPELVEYIWGTKIDTPWDINSAIDFPDYAIFFNFDAEYKMIKLNIDNYDLSYSIININGQQIKAGIVEPYSEISVSNISSGLYFIKFNSNQIKAIRKYIID